MTGHGLFVWASGDDYEGDVVDGVANGRGKYIWANGNSYEGLTKKAEFTVNEKWNGLCNQAGIDPLTGQTRNYNLSLGGISKKTIALLVGGSVAFVALLGLFAFFMRRRNLAK